MTVWQVLSGLWPWFALVALVVVCIAIDVPDIESSIAEEQAAAASRAKAGR